MHERLDTFGKRSDLTLKTFEREKVIGHSLEQSLLLYTVFRNCEFVDVDFQNCDLEGCRFEDSTFVRCSFVDTDIRSVSLTKCHFGGCDFERALLTDLHVTESNLDQCSFSRASITESTFLRSTLSDCRIHRTSFLHCAWEDSKLRDMRIAECTFLYHLLARTTFERVAINVDSLGYLYGVQDEHLRELELIYLSEIQPPLTGNLAQEIVHEFVNRKWLFAAALLSTSTGQVSILNGLNQIIEIFLRSAQTRLGVKRDEVRYFLRLLRHFEVQGMVPLLFVQQAGDRIAETLEDQDLTPADKAALEELQSLLFLTANRLAESFDDMVRNLEALGAAGQHVLMTIRHSHRPSVLFSDLIHASDYRFLTDSPIEGHLVREWEGSWNELILMTTETLLALLTSAALINGILRQFLQIRVLLHAALQPLPRKESRALVASVIKAQPVPVSALLQVARNMLRAGAQSEIPNLDHLSTKIEQATRSIEEIEVTPNKTSKSSK